jgi:large subunit ribosomal protein L9
MDVILLERIGKLGQLGDVVVVKDGYARNFLLPQGKALRATKGNLERFEDNRAELIRTNDDKRGDAEAAAQGLAGTSWVLIRQASESFHLYGSVSARDIAKEISEGGTPVTRQQVRLDETIKSLGVYPVTIALHPEVEIEVTVNVARSDEEAQLQAARPAGPRETDGAQGAAPEEQAPEIEELFEESAVTEVAEAVEAAATEDGADGADETPSTDEEPAAEAETAPEAD